jgi:hypothetical protein
MGKWNLLSRLSTYKTHPAGKIAKDRRIEATYVLANQIASCNL